MLARKGIFMIGFNKASEVFILKTSEKPEGFGLRHANQRLYYNILIAEIQSFSFFFQYIYCVFRLQINM